MKRPEWNLGFSLTPCAVRGQLVDSCHRVVSRMR
jgi:hypothetical protein